MIPEITIKISESEKEKKEGEKKIPEITIKISFAPATGGVIEPTEAVDISPPELPEVASDKEVPPPPEVQEEISSFTYEVPPPPAVSSVEYDVPSIPSIEGAEDASEEITEVPPTPTKGSRGSKKK